MNAQTVFDCDDTRKEIFSYCLAQYPIVTKEMVDERLAKYKQIHNWQLHQFPCWYPRWQGSWYRTLREIKNLPKEGRFYRVWLNLLWGAKAVPSETIMFCTEYPHDT